MTRHADPAPRVHAVVPVKRLSGAKSRLATGLDRPQREELVLAMLADTLRALSGSPLVCGLTVVTPDARAAAAATRCGATVLDEHTALTHPSARRGRSTPPPPDAAPHDALNAALTGAAAVLRDAVGPAHLAFVQADLPALRSTEFTAAASVALEPHTGSCSPGTPRSGNGHAFVADRSGVGTTAVFVCGPRTEIRLGFGAHSAQRHAASGALALAGGWPGLRSDVDTVDDLRRARALGAGPATAAAAVHFGIADAQAR